MDEINQYYKILELEPGASLEEVKEAYRDLAFVWHPDRFVQNSRLQARATVRLKEINEAYRKLRYFLSNSQQQVAPTRPTPDQTPPTPRRPPTSPYPSTPPQSSQRPRDYNTDRGFQEVYVQTSTRQTNSTTSDIPWGSLISTFLFYAMTAWVLIISKAPVWSWAVVEGVAWMGMTVLAIEGSSSQRCWAIAMLGAGGGAGWIAGNYVGGLITAFAWGMVGCSLGVISGTEPKARTVAAVVTIGGVIALVGFLAGNGAENILLVVVGSIVWAAGGFVFGTIVDAVIASQTGTGVGSMLGFILGAWVGAWSAAWNSTRSKTVAIALVGAGPNIIIGSWVAIGIVAGVIAQMVAGEKLIELFNGFLTFLILAIISGLGLGFGWWLSTSLM
ncbi:MAG: J domain-containing protein [Okeania sp. SIO2F4]|uniref:J domain-containing protein n=1 Tax=Okeania sp. SIO2F4 TaxID=2607790 RepID=UPI001428EC8C|nr:J domain-containing protein [Okeania sp. SIO2F4]NES04258.1 J domain-containing protein [Okeania sp. SIO2F4]